MSNQFTEVTSQSWFSRIGSSFKGIAFGFLLFIAGFPVLFWNEGRAVTTFKSLNEGAQSVVSIPSDTINPANEGKLVHTTGMAETNDMLTDPVFGVSSKAIKLKRHVEMYQWKELKSSKTEEKLGGKQETTTTYNYEKAWDDSYEDSSRFKVTKDHVNPSMSYKSESFTAQNVNLGQFKLSPSQISSISDTVNLAVTEEQVNEAKSVVREAVLDQGKIYLGWDPAHPEVGDYRISYEQVLPATISVVAKQKGSTFESYIAKAGGEIDLVKMGDVSAEKMFAAAQQTNVAMTWILRLVGFFMMFIGISSIFKPLSVIADVIPIIGSLVGGATGLVAFLMASFFSSVTIAVAWLASRPALGATLLVISTGLLAALFMLSKKKPAAAPLTQ